MGVKKNLSKYIRLIVYTLIVVLINIAGMTLFLRIDLTKNKIYSISKVSQKVVSTLSEPLTINVFFTKNLPPPYNNTERYLHDLLEEYAIHANKYFNYRFYNVSPEMEGVGPSTDENQKLANNYGIHPIQIQAFEKDEVKFKKAYMGLVLIHGDMVESIPTITTINGLEYQLTTAITKLNNKISALLNLSDKISITLFLSSSLNKVAPYMGLDELPEYPSKIRDIIKSINSRTYDKLEFNFVDPSKENTQESVLKKYQITHLKWPSLSDGEISAGSGIIGLVMEYQNENRQIPILNVMRLPIIGTKYDLLDLAELEEVINENLETLVDINENIGYLADFGTPSAMNFSPMGQPQPGSLSAFTTLTSENYSIKYVNLKDNPIPHGLNSLIIVRPTEIFSDYDLYQIDQALMRGTNLALFIDAFKEIRPPQGQSMGAGPQTTFSPFDSGLEKLLAHYGVRIKKSFVLDENCHKQRSPQSMGGGEMPFYFVPIIKDEFINHDITFMENIKGLIAVKISPLELDEKQITENKLVAKRIFSSSDKSWEMSKNINLNPMFIQPPASDDEKNSIPLAYLLEGEFPSYFAGKPIPEKPGEKDQSQEKNEGTKEEKPNEKTKADLAKIEGKGLFIDKGKPSKIFLMASSEMLSNNILDPEGKSPNEMFIMNVLDELNNREDIAVMRSKIQRFNPLHDTGSTTRTLIKMFNIIGLPVLVVLFGIFVWLRRHSRKRQIQIMFQQ